MPYSTVLSPPKIAVKIANITLVLAVIFSLFISSYAVYLIIVYFDNEWRATISYPTLFAAGLISAILFSFGLRTKENLKVSLCLVIITVGITLYAVETYLEYSQIQGSKNTLQIGRQQAAEKAGVPYDSRTRIEVLADLNGSGIKAWPNIGAREENITTRLIHTFGGISQVTTVTDNESGYYPLIETDEYGFNNPIGLHQTHGRKIAG